jgi:hypothetical protein
MPDVLWVNSRGNLSVVTVDDEGKPVVDEPAAAAPEPAPEPEAPKPVAVQHKPKLKKRGR